MPPRCRCGAGASPHVDTECVATQVLHFSEAADEGEKKDASAAGEPAVAARGNGAQEVKKVK
jgi:hypothetical protein